VLTAALSARSFEKKRLRILSLPEHHIELQLIAGGKVVLLAALLGSLANDAHKQIAR
jgi:hypothetical protein